MPPHEIHARRDRPDSWMLLIGGKHNRGSLSLAQAANAVLMPRSRPVRALRRGFETRPPARPDLPEGKDAGHLRELDLESADSAAPSVVQHRNNLVACIEQLLELGIDAVPGF